MANFSHLVVLLLQNEECLVVSVCSSIKRVIGDMGVALSRANTLFSKNSKGTSKTKYHDASTLKISLN